MTTDCLGDWFDYYCETHDVLASIYNCYCGKQNVRVVVKIFRREERKGANESRA